MSRGAHGANHHHHHASSNADVDGVQAHDVGDDGRGVAVHAAAHLPWLHQHHQPTGQAARRYEKCKLYTDERIIRRFPCILQWRASGKIILT